MLIKNFQTLPNSRGNCLNADLEITAEVEYYSHAEFHPCQAGWQWEFHVTAWKNRACNANGNRQNKPVWRIPNGKLTMWLETQFDGWFHSLSKEKQSELFE